MVRFAFHDAGTFDAGAGTGGANGSIRGTPELHFAPNVGLQRAKELLDEVHIALARAGESMTFADLYQLAGVVALQRCGGPAVPFRVGRVDVPQEDFQDRLPFPSMSLRQLKDTFARMGFDDRELVLLSGAHTIGRAHERNIGLEGAWTQGELVFDNEYYRNLLQPQKGGLIKLASDSVLVSDESTRKWVEVYARDNERFVSEFAQVYQKMSELGMPPEVHSMPGQESTAPETATPETTPETKPQKNKSPLQHAVDAIRNCFRGQKAD